MLFPDTYYEIRRKSVPAVNKEPEFPRFADLPTEIRLKIWNIVETLPRLHEQTTPNIIRTIVTSATGAYDHINQNSILITGFTKRSSTQGVMHACRESRYHFLHQSGLGAPLARPLAPKLFEPFFPSPLSGKLSFVCWEQDTIYVHRPGRFPYSSTCSFLSLITIQDKLSDLVKQRLKNVAIDPDESNKWGIEMTIDAMVALKSGQYVEEWVQVILGFFPAVQRLTFLYKYQDPQTRQIPNSFIGLQIYINERIDRRKVVNPDFVAPRILLNILRTLKAEHRKN